MQSNSQILLSAEPFFFPGQPGQPACLLIHGFTGTPKEMRWMGEFLSQQGYPSLGIRLAGHATRPDDMIRSRYTDWIASVEDGYHFLYDALRFAQGGASPRIYLIGLSMGGVLALLLATRLKVAGVIGLSTLYRIPYDYPVWLIRLLSKFIRYRPKSKEEPGATWFDKESYHAHVSYPENPVCSGAELKLLAAEMRAALPKVDVPVLLIHSKNDTYVLPENMERIYASLGTPDKTKLYITGSGHVLTRDAAREQVFEATSAFIRRVEAAA